MRRGFATAGGVKNGARYLFQWTFILRGKLPDDGFYFS